MPKIRPSHFVLGAHGLALLRHWVQGAERSDERVGRLVEFARELSANPLNAPIELTEMDAADGYAAWSETYDDPNNALIDSEQEAMRSMLESLPPGRALDAACGTGRYTRYLLERGFDTVGIDGSSAMLAHARRKVVATRLARANFLHLPFRDHTFDLVVCGLAIDHSPDLSASVAELSRVIKKGGHLVISVFHPANGIIGGGAFFRDHNGNRGIVKNFFFGVADYVTAFIKAGLQIESCVEKSWTEREILMMQSAKGAEAACIDALAGVPLALVWRLRR